MIKIIKRDGTKVDYDKYKIYNAIRKAVKEVYPNEDKIDICVELITNAVDREIKSKSKIFGDSTFHVETIQDIIVKEIDYDKKLATAYEEYRITRSQERFASSRLCKNIVELIDCKNEEIMTENANKNATVAATQRDLIAGEVCKEIAKTQLPPHILKAVKKGFLKVHDLDYWPQPITNCELINLKDMLDNGTVINKIRIDPPKSLRTAGTVMTQISAQVASNTYGGQTMSISHLAKYVRVSRDKISKYFNDKWADMMDISKVRQKVDAMIEETLQKEIEDFVQTINYQVLTLSSVNGQSPFLSLALYINEDEEYADETAMLIEEFLKQRIKGMKNEHGNQVIQTFPKLLYFLDDDNIEPGTKYYHITELAAKCWAETMAPDFISCKKMREVLGMVLPTMGCRAILSLFDGPDGKPLIYGRGNLGVATINLPYLAAESKGNIPKFYELLDEALELCREVGELRYEKLRGVKASVAPILWQHGALGRLKPDEDILKCIDERGFTVTIGYSGIYETVKLITGYSHITDIVGFEFAKNVMSYLEEKTRQFKEAQPHLRFALYGTPQESTAGVFCDAIKRDFGNLKDITDKGFITNSYHADVREEMDAFTKIEREGVLQDYSKGGAISYIETHRMTKNIPAVIEWLKFGYEHSLYFEGNFESDSCGVCGYKGVMDIDKDLNWVCPQCGCKDQYKLSVIRRTCGYLGETIWTPARKLDIINRKKHL